jgi:hypothetical protein
MRPFKVLLLARWLMNATDVRGFAVDVLKASKLRAAHQCMRDCRERCTPRCCARLL